MCAWRLFPHLRCSEHCSMGGIISVHYFPSALNSRSCMYACMCMRQSCAQSIDASDAALVRASVGGWWCFCVTHPPARGRFSAARGSFITIQSLILISFPAIRSRHDIIYSKQSFALLHIHSTYYHTRPSTSHMGMAHGPARAGVSNLEFYTLCH